MDVSAISPQWLTHQLTRNGHLRGGEVIDIYMISIHKHHCVLTTQYSSNAVTSASANLLIKAYDTEYSWGAREGIFYAEVAPMMSNAPLPACYAVDLQDRIGKTYILMEDLSSSHYVIPSSTEANLDMRTWKQVLESYLVFHTFWWEHPKISEGNFVRSFGLGIAHEATTAALIEANHQHFVEKAFPRWLARDGQHFPTRWHQMCEKAIAAWAHLFLKRTIGGKALTMIHGDAHLQNILLPNQHDNRLPVIVDWEGFTRGLAVWDLSRLLISSTSSDNARRNLEALFLRWYHNRLVENGITNYTLQACYEDYRLCIIANVLLAFDWGDVEYMTNAMNAFMAWDCETLCQ